MAETLFMDYHREDRADIRIARIFNTYGPRMAEADGRVVSNFIVQALRGQELTIYGEGQQTRSFCYVDDLVEGLIRLMDGRGAARAGQPRQPGGVHHPRAGRRSGPSGGSRGPADAPPAPQDDPTQRKPDISRAREWLGWEPRVQLAEGLVNTVAHFRERLRLDRPMRRSAERVSSEA